MLKGDADQIHYANVTLWMLLLKAYDITEYQLAGPDWLKTEGYDIAAKMPSNSRQEQLPLMLQTLLAGRFRLTVHRETKDLPVYALVVGKGGSKLRAVETHEDWHLREGTRLTGRISIPEMISVFNSVVPAASGRDRLIVDMTGLKGVFDISLDFTANNATPKESGTFDGVFDALQKALSSKLGLKLEPLKAPVEILVVDHAEKVPTDN